MVGRCLCAARPAVRYPCARAGIASQRHIASKAMEVSDAQDKLKALENDLKELEVHTAPPLSSATFCPSRLATPSTVVRA